MNDDEASDSCNRNSSIDNNGMDNMNNKKDDKHHNLGTTWHPYTPLLPWRRYPEGTIWEDWDNFNFAETMKNLPRYPGAELDLEAPYYDDPEFTGFDI